VDQVNLYLFWFGMKHDGQDEQPQLLIAGFMGMKVRYVGAECAGIVLMQPPRDREAISRQMSRRAR
jgi:hypothetical protein